MKIKNDWLSFPAGCCVCVEILFDKNIGAARREWYSDLVEFCSFVIIMRMWCTNFHIEKIEIRRVESILRSMVYKIKKIFLCGVCVCVCVCVRGGHLES